MGSLLPADFYIDDVLEGGDGDERPQPMVLFSDDRLRVQKNQMSRLGLQNH